MRMRLNAQEKMVARIFRLTPGEAKLFVQLREAFPDMRDHHIHRLNKESRKVWACSLRKKIKPYGLNIMNIRGKGYQLIEVAA